MATNICLQNYVMQLYRFKTDRLRQHQILNKESTLR